MWLKDLYLMTWNSLDFLWLDRPFNEDEVYGVIHGFNGNKAPSPDWFSMALFQSHWSMLKVEIMEVFQNFNTKLYLTRVLILHFLPLFLKRQMLWRSRILGQSI